MEYLNILVFLILILCIDKLRRKETKIITKIVKDNRAIGKAEQALIKAKIAELFAERAFNLASTANLGVIALQKTLHVPKIVDRQQTLKNKYAKAEVDKLFTTNGGFEFLKPILDDEELEMLEKIEQESSEQ